MTMTTWPRQAASFCSLPDRSGSASGGVGAVQGAQSGPVAALRALSLAAARAQAGTAASDSAACKTRRRLAMGAAPGQVDSWRAVRV